MINDPLQFLAIITTAAACNPRIKRMRAQATGECAYHWRHLAANLKGEYQEVGAKSEHYWV